MISKSKLMVHAAAALLLVLGAACGTAGGSAPTTPPGAPTVLSITPLTDANDVPIEGDATATFSTPMDPATLTSESFTLTFGADAVPVPGTVSYANGTALFTPTGHLASHGWYTATITTAARSLTGVGLGANVAWTFTTAGGIATVPRVTSTTPNDGATGILLDVIPAARFSESMDPATLDEATFTVTSGAASTPVLGKVRSLFATAVFLPTAPLEHDVRYTATVTAGARSAFGQALTASYTWTFTTAP